MPLFMLISGYLFGHSVLKRTWLSTIKNKIQTLIVPILSWCLLSVLCSFVLNCCDHSIGTAVYYLKDYVSKVIYSFWFLWAIFWCSLFVIIANRFCHDNIVIYLLGLILTFVIPDYYGLATYKYMFPYFVIGYLYYNGTISYKINSLSRIILLCVFVLYCILMLFYSTDCFIYTTGYGIIKNGAWDFHQLIIDLHRFLVGILGSILIFWLFHFKSLYASTKVNKIFSYIGKNTLELYIISEYLFAYFIPKVTFSISSYNLLLSSIECILVLTLSLLLSQLIKQSKFMRKIFFGKN